MTDAVVETNENPVVEPVDTPAAATTLSEGSTALTTSQGEAPASVDPLTLVPENVEDYGLPVPEGDSGEFAKQVAPMLKEAGLTKGQAQKLAEAWNKLHGASSAAQAEALVAEEARIKAEYEKQDSALKVKWGDRYDANIELGRRAVRQYGFSAEELSAIESVTGYGALMEKFSKIGESLREDTATGIGQTSAPAMTKEERWYGKK